MLTSAAGAADDFAAPATPASALARCTALPASAFARQYWDRGPLLTTAAELRQDFADLFSAAAVDELLSRRGLRTPFIRMAKQGAVLPPSSFTRSGGSGASIADQVADDRVLDQLAAGATLVLQALHRNWPPLMEFGSRLATEIGHPVQINAYVTPAQNQGFSAHYDTHDVFVLQIAGTKRWTIHPPVLEDPLPDQPWEQRKNAVTRATTAAPLIDHTMAPGDSLYLPRGYVHSAVAQGEMSIHLTIGIHPLTAYDLAARLLAAAATDRDLRRSLPMGVDLADPEVVGPLLRDAADRLAELSRMSAGDRVASIANQVGLELSRTTRPSPIEPLRQLALLDALDLDARLVLRAGLRPALRRSGDTVVLRVIDNSVTWPLRLRPALLMVLAGKDFAVSDLPELTAEDRVAFARRLVREGIVVPAD